MIVVLIYNLLCVLLIFALSSIGHYGLNDIVIVMVGSAVVCQFFNVMLLTGFGGKSVLAGIGLGFLFSSAGMLVATPVRGEWSLTAMRSALSLPLTLTVWAIPLLITRLNWGWQLIDHPQTTIPFRRLRVSDYFLLTTGAAAIWLLYIRSGFSNDSLIATYTLMMFLVLGSIMQLVSLVILGVVHLYFRRGVDEISIFLILFAIYSVPNFLPVFFGNMPWLMPAVLGSSLCAVGSLIGLIVYRLGNLRLVHYAARAELDEEELDQTDQEYLHQSQRSSQIATGLLVLFTIISVLTYAEVDKHWKKVIQDTIPKGVST